MVNLGPLGPMIEPSSSEIARFAPSCQDSPGSNFSESGSPRLLTLPFGSLCCSSINTFSNWAVNPEFCMLCPGVQKRLIALDFNKVHIA